MRVPLSNIVALAGIAAVIAVSFQNCMDYRLGGSKDEIDTVETPTVAATPAPVEAPADQVPYESVTLNDPVGGTDPYLGDSIKWFGDYIYGKPTTPITCNYKNWEDGSAQSSPATILVGRYGGSSASSNTPGTVYPAEYFSLKSGVYSHLRFAPTYGALSFRILAQDLGRFLVELGEGGGAPFSYAGGTHGFQMSISRRPCEFRETSVSQKIFTADYCTAGNSRDYGAGSPLTLGVLATVKATPVTGTPSACELEKGKYYYVNIVNYNQDTPVGRYMLTWMPQ